MADGVDLSRFRFTLRGLSSAIRTLRALIWSLRALEADHSRELSARLRNFERRSGGRIRGDADISCVAGPFFGDGLGVAHHRWGPGRWGAGRVTSPWRETCLAWLAMARESRLEKHVSQFRSLIASQAGLAKPVQYELKLKC